MESLKILTSGKRKKVGFTLIEITVVLALAILVFGFSAALGFDAFDRNYLKTERTSLLSVLQKARSQAMNNISGKKHGFYFDGTNYVIFEGDSYALRDSSKDFVIEKNKGVNLTGLTEVVFDRLTGNVPSCDASPCDIFLTEGSNSVTISINGQGKIEW
jgi:Tfp pilus assembly protein FimT